MYDGRDETGKMTQCNRIIQRREENQLDATECFIALIIC